MYYGAKLTRVQRFPPLEVFTNTKKKDNVIDEKAIKARLQAYQKRLEDDNSSEVSG